MTHRDVESADEDDQSAEDGEIGRVDVEEDALEKCCEDNLDATGQSCVRG